jgi:hypothetical protein
VYLHARALIAHWFPSSQRGGESTPRRAWRNLGRFRTDPGKCIMILRGKRDQLPDSSGSRESFSMRSFWTPTTTKLYLSPLFLTRTARFSLTNKFLTKMSRRARRYVELRANADYRAASVCPDSAARPSRASLGAGRLSARANKQTEICRHLHPRWMQQPRHPRAAQRSCDG